MTGALTGPVVLDAEGLSRAVHRDPYLQDVVDTALRAKVPVVASAATLVEVARARPGLAALRWTVSRFRVVPVSKELAQVAAGLLVDSGLSGHDWALDAMVAATALGLPGRPTVYTSDPDDLRLLLGNRARIVSLR